MSRQRAGQIVGDAAREATRRLTARGLPPLPNVTPHALRRTYISIALQANNFDVEWVMNQVGHADSKMTLDVYAQLEQRAQHAHGTAFDRAAPANSSTAPSQRTSEAQFCPRLPLNPRSWRETLTKAPDGDAKKEPAPVRRAGGTPPAAYGPATIEAFDAWLLRGATPKAKMRRWFAALGDELSHVEVENRPALVLSADIDELTATRPSPNAVHLLPAFDQYVLGPGTNDTAITPAAHRPLVSRAGGRISPVVVVRGPRRRNLASRRRCPAHQGVPGADLPTRELAAAIERMTSLLASTDNPPAASQ